MSTNSTLTLSMPESPIGPLPNAYNTSTTVAIAFGLLSLVLVLVNLWMYWWRLRDVQTRRTERQVEAGLTVLNGPVASKVPGIAPHPTLQAMCASSAPCSGNAAPPHPQARRNHDLSHLQTQDIAAARNLDSTGNMRPTNSRRASFVPYTPRVSQAYYTLPAGRPPSAMVEVAPAKPSRFSRGWATDLS